MRTGSTTILVVTLTCSVRAYDLGEDVTLCWVTSGGFTGENGAWKKADGAAAEREDCQGASVKYVTKWPEQLYSDQVYDISYEIKVPQKRNPIKALPHVNIHSCLRKVGFCTPFVANTPELATHTAAIKDASLDGEQVTVTSEVMLEASDYTIIAHGRWYDQAGRKHDMARATLRDVVDPFPPAYYAVIVLGVLLLAGGLTAAIMAFRKAREQYRSLLERERKNFEQRKLRVDNAVGQAEKLAFPMCCITYEHFKQVGKLEPHEVIRDKGMLKIMDTISDIVPHRSKIVFISHQWYGDDVPPFKVPDPRNCHYDMICKAVDDLFMKGGSAAKAVSPSEILIWVDYISVPQRSPALQSLSINSLATYAGQSEYFIIVAPHIQAKNTSAVFGFESYQKRGWCRLEQWARVSQKNNENMYLCADLNAAQACVSITEDTTAFNHAMGFFTADFTVDADRYKLIDTAICLYYLLVVRPTASLSPSMVKVLKTLKASRDALFPREYFDDLLDLADNVAQGVESSFNLSRASTVAKAEMKRRVVTKENRAMSASV